MTEYEKYLLSKTWGPREEKQQENGENYEVHSSKFIFSKYSYSFKIGVTWPAHVSRRREDEKLKDREIDGRIILK
jgi:hypothetical protein